MSDGFLCVCTCAQQDEYLYWSAISFSLQGVESEEARSKQHAPQYQKSQTGVKLKT